MPRLLGGSKEPNRWCGVLHEGQMKYDWFRTRPIIFSRRVSALTGEKVAKDREYTGMESFWKAAIPFLTSARATSCGVDTITVPVWGTYPYEADVRAERNARTIDVDELSQRERYIARPGRHVYDEDVKARAVWISATPVDVEEQLLHGLLHHETAPGDRCIGAGEQKPDGHG